MATEAILAAPDVSRAGHRFLARSSAWSDYWAMTKPDVNLLIAITTATAFCVAAPAELSDFPWARLLHTLVGTFLVASGAATLNQWMERRYDARMVRTARRPVAAGRIGPGRAFLSGALLSFVGVAYLRAATGVLPSLLATLTLLGYLFLYTPAKRTTPLCTLIGAVPGAIPPLIGWAAARGRLDAGAWMLFAIVFFWQFPHFMAIAWMYRDDYDRAGYLVLPRGEARGRLVTVQTLWPLLALLLASVLPALAGRVAPVYATGAVLLGIGFLDCGARFALRTSAAAARQLLLASIIYLPLLFALMIVSGLRFVPKVAS